MLVFHKKDIPFYAKMDERLSEALQLIASGELDNEPVGKIVISERLHCLVQEYETKEYSDTKWESHEKYIDIQYVCQGRERMDVWTVSDTLELQEVDQEADCRFYKEKKGAESEKANQICCQDGMMAVFYPSDIHRPCICAGQPEWVKKRVFKIRS